MDILWLLALHLGPLHPVEKILTLVLAFGPFVLLGIVILVRRRAEDDLDGQPGGGAGDDAGGEAGARSSGRDADAGSPGRSQRDR